MAKVQGNQQYASVNGTVFASNGSDGIFVQCKLSLKTEEQDTTAGSGTEWKDRGDGLSETTFELTITMDDTRDVADLAAFTNSVGRGQVVTGIFGPRGNTAGYPKHEQDYLITSVEGPDVQVTKPVYQVKVSGMSAGAPTTNMFAGGTW